MADLKISEMPLASPLAGSEWVQVIQDGDNRRIDAAQFRGLQGEPGPAGPKGDTGATGPAGPTVPATATVLGGVKIGTGVTVETDGTISVPAASHAPGVGSASYKWAAPAQSGDPGTGRLGVNADAWLSATQLLIDSISARSIDISAWLAVRKAGDRVRIQDAANSASYVLYAITGAPVNNTTHWTVPVKVVESVGAEFTNNKSVTVTFSAATVGSNTAGIAGAVAITNIVKVTQAQYDAIGSKDATTLYVIAP